MNDRHRKIRYLLSHQSPLPLYRLTLVFLLLGGFGFQHLLGQEFTRINIDQATYSLGLSWIDYDSDGDLDLSYNWVNSSVTNGRTKLFRNDGADTFVEITEGDLVTDISNGTGQTWADYDNDGDPDVYITNNYWADIDADIGCTLYRNEGGGQFTRISDGEISSDNQFHGWGASWGDYDQDGFADLFILTPAVNVYPGSDTLSNVFFDNSGDGTFSRNLSTLLVNGMSDSYTNPTWSDYDQDGDLDVVVTAGRVTELHPDYFFNSQLANSGSATFEADVQDAYATDSRDGQVATWIDYDNDQDLDLYISNFLWPAGIANDLYRNDGGVFTKVVDGDHVTDSKLSIAHTWGDFDNDGDLDLYVSNSTSVNSSGGNNYYQNDGYPDYTFTKVTTGDFVQTNRGSNSAAPADYDNDGDLDMFVSYNSLVGQPALDALYRNDLDNGNHWINIICVGAKAGDPASSGSNRSGLGAKVMARATVFGNTVWQYREVGAQKVNLGQYSIRVHFGFGDAEVIDSLRIEWPSGITDVYEDVTADRFYLALEGEELVPNPLVGITEEEGSPLQQFELAQNYPNPFNPSTLIRYSLIVRSEMSLVVYDLSGKRVRTLIDGVRNPGYGEVEWNGRTDAGEKAPSGVYFYKVQANGFSSTKQMVLTR